MKMDFVEYIQSLKISKSTQANYISIFNKFFNLINRSKNKNINQAFINSLESFFQKEANELYEILGAKAKNYLIVLNHILIFYYGLNYSKIDFFKNKLIEVNEIINSHSKEINENRKKHLENINIEEWKKDFLENNNSKSDITLLKGFFSYIKNGFFRIGDLSYLKLHIGNLNNEENYVNLLTKQLVLNKTKTKKKYSLDIDEPLYLYLLLEYYDKGIKVLFKKSPNSLSKYALRHLGVSSMGFRNYLAMNNTPNNIEDFVKYSHNFGHSPDVHFHYYMKDYAS